MVYIVFREPGQAYSAAHRLRAYYKAVGQNYDPDNLVVQGRRLSVAQVPQTLLEKALRGIDKYKIKK